MSPSLSPSRPRSSLRLALGILGVALCVLPARAAEAARDAIKLLTVGSSFTDDSTALLPDLAKAASKDLLIFRASLGGCSLERHARHLAIAKTGHSATDTAARPYKNTDVLGLPELKTVSLIDALKAQPWDYVTIQQVSTQSFKPASYEPHAAQLIAAIRELAPQAEIVIQQIWAYREDHAIFQKNDGFTPAKMYADARAAYHELSVRYGGLRILPVGDALSLARQTPRWTYVPDAAFDFANPPAGQLPDQRTSLNTGWRWVKNKETGVEKLELDAIHCNQAGRYLGATVWYQVLFNTTEIPTEFILKGLTAEDTADLRVHALAAVAGTPAAAALK